MYYFPHAEQILFQLGCFKTPMNKVIYWFSRVFVVKNEMLLPFFVSREKKREIGNNLYTGGDYAGAINSYQR